MNDNTFVIADPHFGHRNLICSVRELPRVPEEFADMDPVEFMNMYMIGAWNSVVSPADEVLLLGDIAFNMNPEQVAHTMACLNGRKILLRGNHDRGKSHNYWVRMGFAFSFDGPIVLRTLEAGRIMLSHEPVHKPVVLNVCGHMHMSNNGLGPKHICVSAERLDYKPVRLGSLLRDHKVQ